MTASCPKSKVVLKPHVSSSRRHVFDFDPPNIRNDQRILGEGVTISQIVSLSVTPAGAATLTSQEITPGEEFQGRTIQAGTAIACVIGGMNGTDFTIRAVVLLSNGETEGLDVDVEPQG
jgi:hypothetical protein